MKHTFEEESKDKINEIAYCIFDNPVIDYDSFSIRIEDSYKILYIKNLSFFDEPLPSLCLSNIQIDNCLNPAQRCLEISWGFNIKTMSHIPDPIPKEITYFDVIRTIQILQENQLCYVKDYDPDSDDILQFIPTNTSKIIDATTLKLLIHSLNEIDFTPIKNSFLLYSYLSEITKKLNKNLR